MSTTFSPEELSSISALKAKYPEPKAAIMPVLWMAQKKWGWLSEEVMKEVANVMDLPYAHVLGVASFYTMYFKKPMGTNVSCMLRGGEALYTHAKQRLGIGHNQATADGKYSLEEVECMGACGGAPMIAVNETFYENCSQQQLDAVLDGCH
jgi:NADH-quinone oxidoreductase subunit E